MGCISLEHVILIFINPKIVNLKGIFLPSLYRHRRYVVCPTPAVPDKDYPNSDQGSHDGQC